MSVTERVVTVMGATGYTGRLIAAELKRRETRFAIAGRSAQKLQRLSASLGGVESLIVDVGHAASLVRLAESSSVIINCVGPFVDLGEPVVRAAIAHGAHYIDTTGEQAFIKALQAQDAVAKDRGVAVVPAMAFEVALADCAAAVAAEGYTELQAIEVTYAVPARASQGSQRTMLRLFGTPGYSYLGGKLVQEAPAQRLKKVELPPPVGSATAISFPSAEVLTIPMHERVRQVRTYIVLPAIAARLISGMSSLLPVAMRALRPLLSGVVGDGTDGPDDTTRRASHFHIVVEVRGLRRGRARTRRAVVSGADPYGLTAAIAASAAELMSNGHFQRSGVLAPAGAVEPREFLDALKRDGVTYRVHDD